ncbi:hypothetical protein H4R19_003712, partial [Coemansia spiralis]
GQYVVRAFIVPALEYCLLGIPLTEAELQKVIAPVMRKLRHCFTVHAGFPSTFFYHRQGARVPWLVTRYDGMLITAHRRMMNGDGAPCFAALATAVHDATARSLEFPGDVLAHPEHAATIPMRHSGRRIMLLRLAHCLAHRGIALREPRLMTDRQHMILDLRPPHETGAPLRSLYNSRARTIRDAVTLFVEPRQGDARAEPERRYTVRNGQGLQKKAHEYVRDITRLAFGLHGAAASPSEDSVANRDLIRLA